MDTNGHYIRNKYDASAGCHGSIEMTFFRFFLHTPLCSVYLEYITVIMYLDGSKNAKSDVKCIFLCYILVCISSDSSTPSSSPPAGGAV